MTTFNAQQILDCPMAANDAGAKTIREYLKALLRTLWDEGDSFSGKRPFGNSDWQMDLEVALIEAELVEGEINDDGDIVDADDRALLESILAAIEAL